MFVTANKNVNIRLSSPQVASPCGGFVSINSQVEVIDIVAGDVIDGISIWYLSKQNQYLWSGGFVMTDDIFQPGKDVSNLPDNTIRALYESALHELTSKFKFEVEGCTGVGIGKDGENTSLFIYMDEQPQSFNLNTTNYRGVTLNVSLHLTGGIKACTIFKDANSPFLLGGTVSDSALSNEYGTRTVYIKINDIGQYLLTCYHIVCITLLKKRITSCNNNGSALIPAPVSNSSIAPKKLVVTGGSLDPSSDYAIVNIGSNSNFSVNEIPDAVGVVSDYYTINDLNNCDFSSLTLTKFGATTQTSVGTVIKYKNDAIAVDYSDVGYSTVEINGLITATNNCQPGDSGAPVVDGNNKLLGYIIAADNKANGACYIMPVAYLFFNNDYSLYQD